MSASCCAVSSSEPLPASLMLELAAVLRRRNHSFLPNLHRCRRQHRLERSSSRILAALVRFDCLLAQHCERHKIECHRQKWMTKGMGMFLGRYRTRCRTIVCCELVAMQAVQSAVASVELHRASCGNAAQPRENQEGLLEAVWPDARDLCAALSAQCALQRQEADSGTAHRGTCDSHSLDGTHPTPKAHHRSAFCTQLTS